MELKLIKTEEDYKQALAKLEEIFDALPNTKEGDELEIEASMKLFEEGMKLINECNADLDTLEGKITIMIDGEEKEFEGSLEV